MDAMGCVRRGLGALAAAAALLLPATAGAAPAYTVTDLGTLGGATSSAADLNEAGDVVGWSRTASGQVHAFLWHAGAMRDLGTLGGPGSAATGVNDRGAVVGRSALTAGAPRHGFLWRDGAMQDLGRPRPTRIGNSGAIVGNITGARQFPNAAYRNGDAWRILPKRGFDGSVARDVNDAGAAVGFFFFDPHGGAPFLLRHGRMHVLPSVETAAETAAEAINDRGEIAGQTFDPLGIAIFRAGAWHPVPSPSLVEADVHDMNDCGQIVGAHHPVHSFLPHAFLLSEGGAVDLNRAIPAGSGWRLGSANAINDRGEIVGVGRLHGLQHGFLLRPVGPVAPCAP